MKYLNKMQFWEGFPKSPKRPWKKWYTWQVFTGSLKKFRVWILPMKDRPKCHIRMLFECRNGESNGMGGQQSLTVKLLITRPPHPLTTEIHAGNKSVGSVEKGREKGTKLLSTN